MGESVLIPGGWGAVDLDYSDYRELATVTGYSVLARL